MLLGIHLQEYADQGKSLMSSQVFHSDVFQQAPDLPNDKTDPIEFGGFVITVMEGPAFE